jgi:hypothetical protein
MGRPNGGLQSVRVIPSSLCSAPRSGNLISVERPIRSSLLRSYPQLPQLPQVERSSGKLILNPWPTPPENPADPYLEPTLTVDIPPFVSRSFGNPHFTETGFCQLGKHDRKGKTYVPRKEAPPVLNLVLDATKILNRRTLCTFMNV